MYSYEIKICELGEIQTSNVKNKFHFLQRCHSFPYKVGLIWIIKIGSVQWNRSGGKGLSQADVVCNSILNGHFQDSKLMWQPYLADMHGIKEAVISIAL